MCSPMPELPDHYLIPVTIDGRGPAGEHETDHFECWCCDPDCTVFPAQPVPCESSTHKGLSL